MAYRSLTIMFTDMKGFTQRTSEQSRRDTIDMIKQHRELLLPVIAKFGGRLIKSIGDAFLVTFESPTDAVLAGMALQETLHGHNAGLPNEEKVEIRVAINTGEVLLEDGDVYGEAVNIAARIEGIAEPNEIYFTESTYLSMNRFEVPSAEIGLRILKGIPDKIKVFKVLRDASTEPFRAVPPVQTPPPLLTPAPRLRRVLAFGLDAFLVLVLVVVLTSQERSEVRQAREALGTKAAGLAERVPDAGQEEIAAGLWGDGPLAADLAPQKQAVMGFREERNRLLAQEKNPFRQHQRSLDRVCPALPLHRRWMARANHWKSAAQAQGSPRG
jgi:adenylate cyclase